MRTVAGDTCTLAAGKLTVTCDQQGSALWPDTEATVAHVSNEKFNDVT